VPALSGLEAVADIIVTSSPKRTGHQPAARFSRLVSFLGSKNQNQTGNGSVVEQENVWLSRT
jgi:hypothetical protein